MKEAGDSLVALCEYSFDQKVTYVFLLVQFSAPLSSYSGFRALIKMAVRSASSSVRASLCSCVVLVVWRLFVSVLWRDVLYTGFSLVCLWCALLKWKLN